MSVGTSILKRRPSLGVLGGNGPVREQCKRANPIWGKRVLARQRGFGPIAAVPESIPCPERATLALINPHAGHAAALIEPLRAALGADRLEVTPDAATARSRLAALPPRQRVIVVGGDGTLQALLTAFVERDHELALLPLGNGNDLARALGLVRRDWRATLAHLDRAPASSMDLGRLDVPGRAPQWFASSLAIGFDAAVGHRVHRSSLRLRGLLRYLHATFAELRTLQPYELEVALDSEPAQRARFLLASCLNTATYGAGMRAAPGARIDDGRLQWLGVRGWGKFTAPLALPLMLAGLHRGLPGIALRDFARAHFAADAPVPLLLDGEPAEAAARFEVTVRPAALRVVRA